jgi:hypothetical protein
VISTAYADPALSGFGPGPTHEIRRLNLGGLTG